LDGSSVATTNIQARISDWLDGTTTTTAFLSGIDGMTDSQSGFSSTVQSAKKIYARGDDSFEVDTTVLANTGGFKEIINGLRAITEMSLPVEGVDQPTKDDFYTVLNSVYGMVQTGVDGLRDSSGRIAAASQTLDVVRDNHTTDKQNLLKVLEDTESADTTDAIVKFQALQNQLDASFQVTAILSQLSLARILGS
jgi:flagellar hook-associated protein 3 FlgL